MIKSITVSEKLRTIISKHYKIVVFKEVAYCFLPICIIEVNNNPLITDSESPFKHLQQELKQIGFQVRLQPLSEKELRSYDIAKIQLGLAVATSIMVFLSGIFYVDYIEPYYSSLYHSQFGTSLAIFFFWIGMLTIIVVHEFGHFILSKYHKLECSHPFLIPGPPPLGMFGAYVSIRDDPQTRNQQFDVAMGGIIFGLISAFILLIIGFQFSELMDTEKYIAIKMAQSNRTYVDAAEFIKDHLNNYNLLFFGLRTIFFSPISFGSYEGVYLPSKILILHPLAYAGWIGLILSGLNLVPISFFDGGHILQSVLPIRFVRLIGLIIGTVIFLSLNFNLFYIALFGIPGACNDFNSKSKLNDVPNPTVKLKRSRIILACCLVFIFITLYPLTFNNLIFGFGN
ncbi:MAG: site-2 protease family protein [Candidatus Lokiarchaeota archaeon]